MRRIIRFFVWLSIALALVLAAFRIAALWRENEDRVLHMPDEGSTVQTALGEVYIEQSGPPDGIPVLLVHGSVGWSRFWFETTEALAQAGYRAIAFDLSPMGYSERDPEGDYNRIKQADRITALVDAMRIKPVLVAHSFGAGPGAEAVMRAQDKFAAFVIVDGAIGLGTKDDTATLPLPLRSKMIREAAVSATITNPLLLKPLVQMFLHRKEAATEPYMDLLKRPFHLDGTTEELAQWLPTLLLPPRDALSILPESYANLTLPTGIIWGAEDTATPLEQGIELRTLINGATLTVLPGLGHIPQIEDPAAFQKALLDTLGQF